MPNDFFREVLDIQIHWSWIVRVATSIQSYNSLWKEPFCCAISSFWQPCPNNDGTHSMRNKSTLRWNGHEFDILIEIFGGHLAVRFSQRKLPIFGSSELPTGLSSRLAAKSDLHWQLHSQSQTCAAAKFIAKAWKSLVCWEKEQINTLHAQVTGAQASWRAQAWPTAWPICHEHDHTCSATDPHMLGLWAPIDRQKLAVFTLTLLRTEDFCYFFSIGAVIEFSTYDLTSLSLSIYCICRFMTNSDDITSCYCCSCALQLRRNLFEFLDLPIARLGSGTTWVIQSERKKAETSLKKAINPRRTVITREEPLPRRWQQPSQSSVVLQRNAQINELNWQLLLTHTDG